MLDLNLSDQILSGFEKWVPAIVVLELSCWLSVVDQWVPAIGVAVIGNVGLLLLAGVVLVLSSFRTVGACHWCRSYRRRQFVVAIGWFCVSAIVVQKSGCLPLVLE
jgi:predicted lysophospholipase L1 biosynthesis ABC-type transport system permease subunit